MFLITLLIIFSQNENDYLENTSISINIYKNNTENNNTIIDDIDDIDDNDNLTQEVSIFLILFISWILLWCIGAFLFEVIIRPFLLNHTNLNNRNLSSNKLINSKSLEECSEVIINEGDFDLDLEEEQLFLLSVSDSKNNLIVITREDQCSICMENYLCKKQKIIKFNECNHIFHEDCINKWIIHNKTCPICRTNVIKSL